MNHAPSFDSGFDPAPHASYLTEKQCFSRIGVAYLSIYILQVLLIAFFWLTPVELADTTLASAVAMFSMYLLGVPITALLMQRVPARTPQHHAPTLRMFLACLLIGISLMYLGSLAGTLAMQGIDSVFGTTNSNDLDAIASETNPFIWTLAILLAAPIFEEILFRKLLLDRIRQFGEKPAMLLSGILFGLFHGNFYQFFYAASIGCVLAYLYLRTGRLRYSILLHLCINLVGGVLTPAMTDPAAWLPSGFATPFVSALLSYGYAAAMFLCVIAGILLLLSQRHQLQLHPPECTLPQGYVRTAFGNVGMVLFALFTLAEFATDIFL